MSTPCSAIAADECFGVGLGPLVDDVHAMAVEQRDQGLPGGVERERPRVRDAQRPTQPVGRGPQHGVQMIVGVGAQLPREFL